MTDITVVSSSGEKYLLKSDGTWTRSTDDGASSEGFRGFMWGDPLAKIEETTNSKELEGGKGCVVHTAEVANLSAYAIYFFANSQLVSGQYKFNQEHADPQGYLDDYWAVKDLLVKKYGHPDVSETIWSNDLYQENYSDWGTAISVGHLMCWEKWSKGDTEITLAISGDNFEIQHGIVYRSILLAPLLDEQRQKYATDGL